MAGLAIVKLAGESKWVRNGLGGLGIVAIAEWLVSVGVFDVCTWVNELTDAAQAVRKIEIFRTFKLLAVVLGDDLIVGVNVRLDDFVAVVGVELQQDLRQ